jgi:hypothetical protein
VRRCAKQIRTQEELREAIAGSVREREIQEAIVQYLKLNKLAVLVTNVSVRKAAAEAGRNAVGFVCSPGVPDLLVTSRYWPEGAWLGLEVKRPGGKLSPAQKAEGRIVVVRSIDDAREAVKAFSRHLHVWQDPAIVGGAK